MRSRRLLWQLFPSYVAIAVVSILAVGWFAGRSVRQSNLQYTFEILEAHSRLIGEQVRPFMSTGDIDRINAACVRLGHLANARVTVVAPDGTVWGDSHEDFRTMANHADRPEVMRARTMNHGEAVRYSATRRTKMVYAAVSVMDGARLLGIVRASYPLSRTDATVTSAYGRIALGIVIVALLAALVSLAVSRRITRPLEQLTRGAEQFALGRFDAELPTGDATEIGALASAMNKMATNLSERADAINDQKSQERTILKSMSEAVVAINMEARLLLANPAAEELFDFVANESVGTHLQEVIRNYALLTQVHGVLNDGDAFEDDITIRSGKDERELQIHGTPLQTQDGTRVGALVVFNDITHLRRLERVRRDFVANVSHELKTPITAIKGFVETLLEGALDERASAERFLGIVSRHTDRLSAITEDLLELSRIEQEQEHIPLEVMPLKPIVAQAADVCRHNADQRGVLMAIEVPGSLTAAVNAPLMERALVNLIDNAIKYSDAGDLVTVSAEPHAAGVAIRVSDQGVGIDNQHLPRLFERFYRTDKARSREMGGTGLGLAIVKHIVLAHGGKVEVESEIGRGSTFTILI